MNLIDKTRAIQRHVGTKDDGKWGINTANRCVQMLSGSGVDGQFGNKTADAVIEKLGIKVSVPSSSVGKWPTQAEVRSGKSIFGKAGDESNLVMINFPYTMYYDGSPSTRLRVHKLIAEPLMRIFQRTLEHYGLEEIKRLGLDTHGGCFNYRKTVGGSSTSMHAWGIAIDLDPSRNAYSCRAPHAGLSRPECEAFWKIVEDEGAVSLGRAAGYDWMHFQFARLS